MTKASASRVVRLVDENLYQVPPLELVSHRPRRKQQSLNEPVPIVRIDVFFLVNETQNCRHAHG